MFRGEKNTQGDGGFRVPAAIRWPGVIKPGTLINDIAAHEDMIPTFPQGGANGDLTDKKKVGSDDVTRITPTLPSRRQSWLRSNALIRSVNVLFPREKNSARTNVAPPTNREMLVSANIRAARGNRSSAMNSERMLRARSLEHVPCANVNISAGGHAAGSDHCRAASCRNL
jgi:hypothetical protein